MPPLGELGIIAGYGWYGPGETDKIPQGNVTCALRISEDFQGKGLARPFFCTLVEHAMSQNPSTRLWSEVWDTNQPSLRMNRRVGFTTVPTEETARRTKDDRIIPDIRHFMLYEGVDGEDS